MTVLGLAEPGREGTASSSVQLSDVLGVSLGTGFGAAILTTVAIALAGGPMGTGRMADIGAPVGEVLVSAVAAMSLGGLLAGLATAWWQRRHAARTAPADD